MGCEMEVDGYPLGLGYCDSIHGAEHWGMPPPCSSSRPGLPDDIEVVASLSVVQVTSNTGRPCLDDCRVDIELDIQVIW